jgi:hypothetical protein
VALADLQIRKSLGVKEYWCGRASLHTAESLHRPPPERHTSTPGGMVRSLSHKLSRRPDVKHQGSNGNGSAIVDEPSEVERQAQVMATTPNGLYERFRRGLLEYHSEVRSTARMCCTCCVFLITE